MRKRILVIDDDIASVSAVRRILKEGGYEPVVASNAADAEVVLEHDDPALVLLFLATDGNSGLDICASIREQAKDPMLPILMFSDGKGPVVDVASALAHGGDGYFGMPVPWSEVAAKVDAYLGVDGEETRGVAAPQAESPAEPFAEASLDDDAFTEPLTDPGAAAFEAAGGEAAGGEGPQAPTQARAKPPSHTGQWKLTEPARGGELEDELFGDIGAGGAKKRGSEEAASAIDAPHDDVSESELERAAREIAMGDEAMSPEAEVARVKEQAEIEARRRAEAMRKRAQAEAHKRLVEAAKAAKKEEEEKQAAKAAEAAEAAKKEEEEKQAAKAAEAAEAAKKEEEEKQAAKAAEAAEAAKKEEEEKRAAKAAEAAEAAKKEEEEKRAAKAAEAQAETGPLPGEADVSELEAMLDDEAGSGDEEPARALDAAGEGGGWTSFVREVKEPSPEAGWGATGPSTFELEPMGGAAIQRSSRLPIDLDAAEPTPEKPAKPTELAPEAAPAPPAAAFAAAPSSTDDDFSFESLGGDDAPSASGFTAEVPAADDGGLDPEAFETQTWGGYEPPGASSYQPPAAPVPAAQPAPVPPAAQPALPAAQIAPPAAQPAPPAAQPAPPAAQPAPPAAQPAPPAAQPAPPAAQPAPVPPAAQPAPPAAQPAPPAAQPAPPAAQPAPPAAQPAPPAAQPAPPAAQPALPAAQIAPPAAQPPSYSGLPAAPSPPPEGGDPMASSDGTIPAGAPPVAGPLPDPAPPSPVAPVAPLPPRQAAPPPAAAAPVAPPEVQPTPTPAPFPESGDLLERDLPRLLADLYRARATGVLEIHGAAVARACFIELGRVVGASSTSAAERLEEVACRLGRITRQQARQVRAQGDLLPRQVAMALVEAGQLKAQELYDTVRAQAQSALFGAFAEEEGRWRWVQAICPEDARVALPDHPFALIAEGIRRKYTLPRIHRCLGGPATVVAPTETTGDWQRFGFSARERRVATSVDGLHSAEELVFLSGLGEEPTYQVLYILESTGQATVRVRGAMPEGRAGTPEEAKSQVSIDRVRIEEKFRQALDADYFEILGVTRDATGYEIKEAYERLAREMQPARFADPGYQDLWGSLEEIRRSLDDAYDVLRDEGLRHDYLAALS